MQWTSGRVAFAAALVLVPFPLAAKAPLEKVTVTGPPLATPFELTDQETLRLSNPWYGKFIEWSAPPVEGPQGGVVYDVALHARLRGSELRPIYRFRYAPRGSGQRGLVYLPGRGEPWHRENVGIIIRANHDGRWNLADAQWDARLKAALSHKVQEKAAEQ
jgi:hypothetical protein